MSMKSLPTLKGVFPQPKPPPKRDFLKENKQKLKAIQKFSTQKQINSENDEHCSRRSQHRRDVQVIRSRSIPPKRIGSSCSCISKNSQGTAITTNQVSWPRNTTSCDKSIQTDDIIDETFLSNALRRCSSRDSAREDYASDAFTRKLPYITDTSIHNDSNLNVDLMSLDGNDHLADLPDTALYKLHAKNGLQEIQRDELCKVQNKISNRSDLRSRKEIKIPKYLEREKREKELKKLREMEKDPQCPDGHYALSEEDRKEALKTAENQFKELVDELNRMPMSGETLRIRTRKMEIEKALIKLENNIRTFSKQKVYVKTDK